MRGCSRGTNTYQAQTDSEHFLKRKTVTTRTTLDWYAEEV
jgi:hypothetical protein